MKKFENNYKKLMDKVELSKTEKESIKNNIILKKDKFIVKKLLVTISAVVIIFTISMTVNALINHYTIIKNDEYNKKTIYNGYIDKDYSVELFEKGEDYDIEEIESKLKLEILRNDYIKDYTFNLYNFNTKNNNITKLNFWLKNINDNIRFGFEIKTEENEISEFSISGNVDLKTYIIKNLNTEVVIYETKNDYAGPLLANFEYNGIIYSIELDKVDYSLNDLYKILESFYK